jgi:hypothetical protein
MCGYGPTARASGGDVEGARVNQHFGRLGFDAFDGEPARSKRDPAIHDGDFLSIRRSRLGQIASGLSQSPFSTPNHIRLFAAALIMISV